MNCKFIFPPGHQAAGDTCGQDEFGENHDLDFHQPFGGTVKCSGGVEVGCMYHPFAPEPVIESIDLTPSVEGFAQIAKVFSANIIGDVRLARTGPSRDLLIEVIKIAAHLGREGRDDLLVDIVKAVRG